MRSGPRFDRHGASRAAFPMGSVYGPVRPSAMGARVPVQRREQKHCQGQRGRAGQSQTRCMAEGPRRGHPWTPTLPLLRQGQQHQAVGPCPARRRVSPRMETYGLSGQPAPMFSLRLKIVFLTFKCNFLTSSLSPLPITPSLVTTKQEPGFSSQDDLKLQKSCTCIRKESGTTAHPKMADGPQLSTLLQEALS